MLVWTFFWWRSLMQKYVGYMGLPYNQISNNVKDSVVHINPCHIVIAILEDLAMGPLFFFGVVRYFLFMMRLSLESSIIRQTRTYRDSNVLATFSLWALFPLWWNSTWHTPILCCSLLRLNNSGHFYHSMVSMGNNWILLGPTGGSPHDVSLTLTCDVGNVVWYHGKRFLIALMPHGFISMTHIYILGIVTYVLLDPPLPSVACVVEVVGCLVNIDTRCHFALSRTFLKLHDTWFLRPFLWWQLSLIGHHPLHL